MYIHIYTRYRIMYIYLYIYYIRKDIPHAQCDLLVLMDTSLPAVASLIIDVA